MAARSPGAPGAVAAAEKKIGVVGKITRSLSFDRARTRLKKDKSNDSSEGSGEAMLQQRSASDGAKPRAAKLTRALSFERRDPFDRLRRRFPECTEEEIKWAVRAKGGAINAQTAKLLEQLMQDRRERTDGVTVLPDASSFEAHLARKLEARAAKERDAALAERDASKKKAAEAAAEADRLRTRMLSVAADLELGDDEEARRKLLEAAAQNQPDPASLSNDITRAESMAEPSWLADAAEATVRDFGDRASFRDSERQNFFNFC